MTPDQVRAMRQRGYPWRDIAHLCNISTFACWMAYGPLGWRTR